MTRFLTIVAAAGAGFATMGAADPDLGHSVTRNIVTQVVDMHPHYAGVPMEGGSGARSVDSVRRYLKGEVKQLIRVTASTNVGQQGGAQ